ncbi:MobA/MobL family protein [uncultured Bradyrhizobium sp.]|uniref:MobA/MobL family protein n=1 Tax=uncultured Bradyrhizobium sp. TaxID=199684 RepID=UPI0035CB4E99
MKWPRREVAEAVFYSPKVAEMAGWYGMAIYSLNHKFIGRSVDAPGAAGGFARYITGQDRCTETLGRRMPIYQTELIAWLSAEEKADRRNARVIDQIVVALPKELSHEQNMELLEAFGERMTKGRASWMAAIHDGPGDADNPHAHMIFRDRDVETRRRVMMTSEAGSTGRFREAWEQETNSALERAGREERVDSRSLQDQGIDREPQIHVGAAAMELTRRGHDFASAEKQTTRRIEGENVEITVNYPVIDQGKSRFEENEERRARNRELEGPERPEFPEHPAMAGVHASAQRFHSRFNQAVTANDYPEDDGDYINATIRDHMIADLVEQIRRNAERDGPPPFHAMRDRPSYLFDSNDFDRPGPRRGPYPDGPGAERFFEASERDREDLDALEGGESGDGPRTRGPRRDVADAVGGGLLAAIGKLADMAESILDGPKKTDEQERGLEMSGDQDRKVVDAEIEQRRREAEAEAYRCIELEAFLQQRDRERHIDRGR